MKVDKNKIIDYLCKQDKEKSDMLYGLIKDEELNVKPVVKRLPPLQQVKYRTDREIIAAGGHICANCRYKDLITGKCKSKRFKDENEAVIECIAENYKYWEEIDEA